MKRTVLVVAICIVAILVALGVIALFSSFRAYGELKTAKKLLFSARDSLEKRDIQSAAAGFARAQDQIKKADSRLKAHKISIGFLKQHRLLQVEYVGQAEDERGGHEAERLDAATPCHLYS